MGKRYSKEVKSEVLRKIREGSSVRDVALVNGIKETTVRSWMARKAESNTNGSMELSRLRRENMALTELLGRLTVQAHLDRNHRRSNL